MTEEGFPISGEDQREVEFRHRLVELEQRVKFAALVAVCAELGVVALAVLLLIKGWKES